MPNNHIDFGIDLLPSSDLIFNLGNTEQQWKIFGTLTGSATSWTSAQTVYVNLSNASTSTTINGGQSSAQIIGVDGTLSVTNGGTGNNDNFTANRLIYSLSTTKLYNATSIYASTDKITINGTSPPSSGNFQVKGTSVFQHILPESDAETTAYNIGATATRWGSLYLNTSLLVGAQNTAYNSNTKGSFVGPAVFSICVTSAEGGYYIMGASQQYARMYIETMGTSAGTGSAYLELGNGMNSMTANNSRGIIRLYSDNTTYTEVQSQVTKNASNGNVSKIFYLPSYAGNDNMYATHIGGNSAVGSATQPVYVANGGRITATTNTVGDAYTPTYLNSGVITSVYPIQYNRFTFTAGVNTTTTTTTLSHNAYNTSGDLEVIILAIVVDSGEQFLQAPITASVTNGTITLSTEIGTSGINTNIPISVTGYIITARGIDLTSNS